MSRKKSPSMFLPLDDVPTFGRPRRSSWSPQGSGPENEPGVIARLIKGVFRIIFVGLFFKLVVPFGVMTLLFVFGPQLMAMLMSGVTGDEGATGLDGITVARVSFWLLKQTASVFGQWVFGAI